LSSSGAPSSVSTMPVALWLSLHPLAPFWLILNVICKCKQTNNGELNSLTIPVLCELFITDVRIPTIYFRIRLSKKSGFNFPKRADKNLYQFWAKLFVCRNNYC
jgi:hypothetical protein